VVLLHGFAEDGDVWKYQLADLAAGYLVIVPDLPGSGRSDMTDDMSIEGMALCVKKIIDHELPANASLAEDGITMIGHSMGGYITLAFANKYPGLLAGFGLFHSTAFADTEEKITALVNELLKQKEICFDTETTGIDANDAELVGLSFSFKANDAYYIPCSADRNETNKLLGLFKPVFDNAAITWVGQNIKYDMLMLKWYGFELKGNIYDTMLAHYVIEPEGRRSMDLLSAQYLSYEPVHIEELIGKKGKMKVNGRTRRVTEWQNKDISACRTTAVGPGLKTLR